MPIEERMLTKFKKPSFYQLILHYENARVFKSYQSLCAAKLDPKKYNEQGMYLRAENANWDGVTILGGAWNASATTNFYRGKFLGEGVAETRKKINDGTYLLVADIKFYLEEKE